MSHLGYFLLSHVKNSFNFPYQILSVSKDYTVLHVPQRRSEPLRIIDYRNRSNRHRFYHIMTHGHAISRRANEKVGFRQIRQPVCRVYPQSAGVYYYTTLDKVTVKQPFQDNLIFHMNGFVT